MKVSIIKDLYETMNEYYVLKLYLANNMIKTIPSGLTCLTEYNQIYFSGHNKFENPEEIDTIICDEQSIIAIEIKYDKRFDSVINRKNKSTKDILYWVEQLGYVIVDEKKEELLEYIEQNYVRSQNEVVNHYIEFYEIRIPNKAILDYDTICEFDDDYVDIGDGEFLNIGALEDAQVELMRLDLII